MTEPSLPLNPNQASALIIPGFLRSLMKLERERQGLSRQAASSQARWSTSSWGHLERDTRSMQPHHWMNIAAVLQISSEREVRRLNAYIGKHPNIWIEAIPGKEPRIYQKTITSPKPIREKNIIAVDLNRIRPALYYELSRYTVEPEEIITIARAMGFFASREPVALSEEETSTVPDPPLRSNAYRQMIIRQVENNVSDDKLQLLERVLDKFTRFSPADLARAYKHFSLSLKE